MIWNLLPFPKPPTPLNSCPFCGQGQDTSLHLFAECTVTKTIWKVIRSILSQITGIQRKHFESSIALNYWIENSENFIEYIAIILTALNYSIWQTRTKLVRENCRFDHNNILARMYNHITIRKKEEIKQIPHTYLDVLTDVKNLLFEKLQTA